MERLCYSNMTDAGKKAFLKSKTGDATNALLLRLQLQHLVVLVKEGNKRLIKAWLKEVHRSASTF
jgi:hypothetical protein